MKVTRSGATVLTGSLNVARGFARPLLGEWKWRWCGRRAGRTRIGVRRGHAAEPSFPARAECRSVVSRRALSLGSSTDTVYVSLYGTGIRGAGTVQAVRRGSAGARCNMPVRRANTKASTR